MELNPNEEPVWTYFDAQHKSILDQMKEAYSVGKRSVEGVVLCLGVDRKNSLGKLAIHEKTSPSISSPDDLTGIITAQLKTCVSALESKQSDTVIGIPIPQGLTRGDHAADPRPQLKQVERRYGKPSYPS